MSGVRFRTRSAVPALGAAAGMAFASPGARASDAYAAAATHRGRSADDLKRDALDHPAEVLRLAGIRPGLQVADFLAADGYYSELLSYLVGSKGHVFLLNNAAYEEWSEGHWKERIGNGRLPNVEHRTIEVEHLGLPDRSLDAIMVIKVYHDLHRVADQGPRPKNGPTATLIEVAG